MIFQYEEFNAFAKCGLWFDLCRPSSGTFSRRVYLEEFGISSGTYFLFFFVFGWFFFVYCLFFVYLLLEFFMQIIY